MRAFQTTMERSLFLVYSGFRMSRYKKIMVMGGSAVAGGALKDIASVEYADRAFLFPLSRECNLLSYEDTRKYLARHRPDAIIHFAAISGSIGLNMRKPATLLRDNTLMNIHLAEAARECGISKVLMTLSASAYPAHAPVPLKEESLHDGYPHETNYAYDFAKRLIDPMAKAYHTEYGMTIVGIIPGAIIGPRSNFNPEGSTAVPALIRRFFENRSDNAPLVVWGDGTPIRQFTSGEDIGRIAMWCIDHCDEPTMLNVSTNEETSIREAASIIADCLGIEPERIVFDATKPSGTHRQSVDNTKFVKRSGFRYMSARDTIRKAAAYFMEHYPNPAKLRL